MPPMHRPVTDCVTKRHAQTCQTNMPASPQPDMLGENVWQVLNKLDYRILNYFSKTGNVSASNDIDNYARRQLTAPLRHQLAVLNHLFKN